MSANLKGQRAEFCALHDREAPEIVSKRPGWERYVPLGGREDIVLVFSLSQDKASVCMKANSPAATAGIEANCDALSRCLRTASGRGSGQATKGYWFRKDNAKACFTLRSQWRDATRWFRAQYATFDGTIRKPEEAT